MVINKTEKWLWVTNHELNQYTIEKLREYVETSEFIENWQLQQFNYELFKDMIELFDRVIFIDLDWSKKHKCEIGLRDVFPPLFLNKKCEELGIHFTWWIEDFSIHTDEQMYFSLFNKSNLLLCCGTIIHDLKESIKQVITIADHRNVAFFHDILPIAIDMIRQKKTGHFELCNPTPLSVKVAIQLINEFDISIDDGMYDDDSNINQYVFDTRRLESEYFILPSYQAFQRCLKRIRKQSVIYHKVNLEKECSILVTGGFGFIGSNLIHYLFHHFPKTIITNIDRLDYCSREEHVEMLLKSERFVNFKIDLADTKAVLEIIKERKVDYVFHLAAQSHVDNSFNNSLQFSKDNVYATHSLLEACKDYGKIKRFIHISTDEIYGETLQMAPFSEKELPNPTNPYAATKVGAEYIAKSYYHCFELPVIIVRGNNVYGPRQYPEKMIPRFISLLLNNDVCTIAGNGLMKRNFVHVTDVCSGLCTVLLKGTVDEIYNIGDDDEKSVLDVALLLIDIIKKNPSSKNEYYNFVKDRYYNDFRYSIDTTKIRRLGWRPKMDLMIGLQNTIQYYQDVNTFTIKISE